MHGREFIRGGFSHWRTAVSLKYLARVATITFLGTGGYAAYAEVIHPKIAVEAGFRFEPVPPSVSGISSKMSNILQEVDPRVQHIAKWLLSVGDSIAVGDYDNDGFQDIFLTNTLKRPEDRNALYRNLGNYHFERVTSRRCVKFRPSRKSTAWWEEPSSLITTTAERNPSSS